MNQLTPQVANLTLRRGRGVGLLLASTHLWGMSTMPKYLPTDDGTRIAGRHVIFLRAERSSSDDPDPDHEARAARTGGGAAHPADLSLRDTLPSGGGPGGEGPKAGARKRQRAPLQMTPTLRDEISRAQAAALEAAAESGVAFCEECERAKRELEANRP